MHALPGKTGTASGYHRKSSTLDRPFIRVRLGCTCIAFAVSSYARKWLPGPYVSSIPPKSATHDSTSATIMQLNNDIARLQSHGLYHSIHKHRRPFSRCIWTISATNALLSARYLLVEANFHYPVALYIAQIGVSAIIFAIHQTLTTNGTPPKSWQNRAKPGSVLVIAAMCFAALSMMCMLQALLHNKNVTTLVMLSVSSYLHKVGVWSH